MNRSDPHSGGVPAVDSSRSDTTSRPGGSRGGRNELRGVRGEPRAESRERERSERCSPGESVEPWIGLPAKPAYERTKRALDVTVAFLSLAALSPVLLLIAVLIKLTSRGPVLYRGTVIGRYGRPFTYYKFRTMRVDGDDSAHRRFIAQYVAGGAPGDGADEGRFKLVDDPRITAVGRWIRRSSLDEMAQMINVLRGEMSVVGPRPPVPDEYERYPPEHQRRLAVLPGITGLAQVRARGRAAFEEMVAMDREYIRHRSLWLDLAIMARTIGVVLTGRGAR